MRAPFVATLAVLISASASAQDRKPHVVEVDGLFGYTAVDVAKWAQLSRVEESSHFAGGIVVRGLLAHLGTTHVGLELGTGRVFSYTARQETPTQIITEKATVAGFHVLVVGRFLELDRYSWDAGVGWFGLGDASVLGLMTSFNYVLLRTSRFHIPVGARLHVLFNEPAVAATAMARLGISIPLSRTDDASAPR